MYDVAFAKLLQARVKILDATATTPTVALFRPYRNARPVGLGKGQSYSHCVEEWIRLDYISIQRVDNTLLGSLVLQAVPSPPCSQPGPQLLHLNPGALAWTLRRRATYLARAHRSRACSTSALCKYGIVVRGFRAARCVGCVSGRASRHGEDAGVGGVLGRRLRVTLGMSTGVFTLIFVFSRPIVIQLIVRCVYCRARDAI